MCNSSGDSYGAVRTQYGGEKMGKVVLKTETKTLEVSGKKKKIELLGHGQFGRFNPSVLGLGNIALPSRQVEAIAAVFDLSGFTNFCSQVDPHLSVPTYLSRFLDWLFETVRERFVQQSFAEGKELWAPLPFLAKFLGDGVLFLWDTKGMSGVEMCNVVVSLKEICNAYTKEFYPEIITVVVEPPHNLRCGIARGRVFSVGNGEDYVGPCINIASRLQRLRGLTFCFCRRGFDIEKRMHTSWAADFVIKLVSLRGVGENELVYVLKEEFDNLPDKEKELFRHPLTVLENCA